MDSVVTVRRSFLNNIRAFLNTFASMCCGCFRASCDCSLSDEIHRAKMLIVQLDNIRNADEERFYIENPREELFDKIVAAIRQSGKGVASSREINIPGVSRQKKFRAIKSLARRGVLRTVAAEGEIFYAIDEDRLKAQRKTTSKQG